MTVQVYSAVEIPALFSNYLTSFQQQNNKTKKLHKRYKRPFKSFQMQKNMHKVTVRQTGVVDSFLTLSYESNN